MGQINRYLLCLLLIVPAFLQAVAQDSLLLQRISIADTTCSVQSAMELIENETNLSFSYNSGLFNRKKEISFRADHEELIVVLRKMFPDPGLDFSIIGKHIVIFHSVRTLSSNPETKNDSVYFTEIRGRVLDRSDRQPLPYSSIYIAGKSIGTVTNNEGEFLLKLNSKYLSDTLNISCIGYKQQRAPVSSMVSSNRDYLLKPDVISIQEVIIRKISPVTLLQSAVDEVERNYSRDPAILTSFYREIVKKGNRFMMVSEALLENYKAGYSKNAPADRIRIIKARKSHDVTSTDTIILKLKAGLNTMLLLDVVKNLPDFLTGENLSDYSYRLSDIVVDEGRDNYAIEFSPKELSREAFYSGRILLDLNTLAFKWVEFYIDPGHLDRATGLFIVRKPPELKVKVMKANYKVAFKASGNKFFLHMVEAETQFKVREKRQLSASVFSTRLEMAVTEIDSVHADRFKLRETAKINDFFSEQIEDYNESFWGEYNFIRPEESLEEAIIKLNRK